MSNKTIAELLTNLIMDPKDPELNFNIGSAYENLGHNASAVSYYLRAAEFSDSVLLSYEGLLRLSLCLEKLGSRSHTEKGVLLRAISLMPKRPEAYFLLTRLYETCKDWHEGFALAIVAENCAGEASPLLRTNIGYPGSFVFTYERAVIGWWIGLYDESIYLFRTLEDRSDMPDIYSNSVRDNLRRLGRSYKKPIPYDKDLYSGLRFKFPGSQNIDRNYSQCYQDMFVLSMLKGKRDGRFVEIGCDDAYFNSNTALLEKLFGWSGISIDIDPVKTEKFSRLRKSRVITGDATRLDYSQILENEIYDYLQVDCEPADNSYLALQKIPLERYKFAVITFEHDNYCDENKSIREKSRRYLESFGYKMVVNDIAEDRWSNFEDWWIHPDLVDMSIYERMVELSAVTKKADKYMLS